MARRWFRTGDPEVDPFDPLLDPELDERLVAPDEEEEEEGGAEPVREAVRRPRAPIELLEDEEILFFVRHHWLRLLQQRSFWGAAVLLLIGGVLFPVSRRPALLFLAAGLILLAYAFRDWRNDYLVVTDQRLVTVNDFLFFTRQRIDVAWDKVQNVDLDVRSPLQGLLGVGTLRVQTAGEKVADFTFEACPHVRQTHARLRDLLQGHRQRVRRREEERDRTALQAVLLERLTPGEATERRAREMGWPEVREERGPLGRLLRLLFPWIPPSQEPLPGGGVLWRRHPIFLLWRIFPGLLLFFAGLLVTSGLFRWALQASVRPGRPAPSFQTVFATTFLVLVVALSGLLLGLRQLGRRLRAEEATAGTEKDEEAPEVARRVLTLALAVGVAFLLTGGVVLAFLLPRWGPAILALLLTLTVSGGVIYVQYLFWIGDQYILTPRGIEDVYRWPFGLYETRRSTALDRIENIRVSYPPIVGRLLRFGNVLIETAGEKGQFTFYGVASPDRVRDLIQRYQQEARRRLVRRREEAVLKWLRVYHEMLAEGRLPRSGTTPSKEERTGQADKEGAQE